MMRPSTSVPARWRIWRARGVTRQAHIFRVLSRFTAYERWDFSTAIEVLAPLAGEGERIGGGRAQHDLIEFTLLKAYLEVDRLEEARHLLSARRPGLPAFPLRGLRRCTNLRSSQLHGSVPSCRHRRRKLILRAPNNNRRAGLDDEYHDLLPWLVKAAGTFSSWNQTFVHRSQPAGRLLTRLRIAAWVT